MTGAFVKNDDPQLPASLKIAKKLIEIAKEGPAEHAFVQEVIDELVTTSNDEASPDFHYAHVMLAAFAIATDKIIRA